MTNEDASARLRRSEGRAGQDHLMTAREVDLRSARPTSTRLSEAYSAASGPSSALGVQFVERVERPQASAQPNPIAIETHAGETADE